MQIVAKMFFAEKFKINLFLYVYTIFFYFTIKCFKEICFTSQACIRYYDKNIKQH